MKTKSKNFIVLTAVAVAMIAVIFLAQAGIIMAANTNIYDQTYPVPGAGTSSTPQFVVQELKYEPYPVNAGDTFDIWVKVQNIGQADAPNSEFKLDSSYPFTTINSVQDYGIIFGTANAYKSGQQSGDTSIQANQAVIKFQVKVANDAPAGEDTIRLEVATDKSSGNFVVYDLPVTIANSQQIYTGINSSGQNSGSNYMNWVYGAIGLLTGAVIVILVRLVLQKNRKKSK